MTVNEAWRIVNRYDENVAFNEDEEFMYIEALQFIIEKEKNPQAMMQLGGYYYELRQFDLALKYYEMAAALDYDCAYECLGYIWYYGRTGEKDYKKAFEYFSKVMETGNVVAAYKIADMYKNGYYVEKNQAKYEEIIEKLYKQSRKWYIDPEYDTDDSYLPIPEIDTRLAKIRADQGKVDEAIELYFEAKDILSRRLSLNAFFGNINIMKWLINDLYNLREFDYEDFDFYDLFYLLKTPHKVRFMYDDAVFEIESVMEGDECVICFRDKWYQTIDDFVKKATIGDMTLTAICNEFYVMEVVDDE